MSPHKQQRVTPSAVSLVIHNALKHLEVRGERLACAARIVDRHSHIPARCQAEGHRHAVVVIGVDGDA